MPMTNKLCHACGQVIGKATGRVCSECGKPMARHDKFYFVEGRIRHRVCAHPTTYAGPKTDAPEPQGELLDEGK